MSTNCRGARTKSFRFKKRSFGFASRKSPAAAGLFPCMCVARGGLADPLPLPEHLPPGENLGEIHLLKTNQVNGVAMQFNDVWQGAHFSPKLGTSRIVRICQKIRPRRFIDGDEAVRITKAQHER